MAAWVGAALSSRILRNAAITMLGTFSSRVLGLVRQIIINNLFPPLLTDAFNIATRVPNLFRELVAEGAVTNALVPVLSALPADEGEAFKRRFAALLFALNLLLLGLGLLLAPWIADLLVDSSSPFARGPNFELLVYQIRLVMPFLLFISMAALFSAFLQSQERFGLVAFAPLALNVVSIVIMLIWPGSATALALSYTLGAMVQAAVLLPSLKGFRLELKGHRAIRDALWRMGPFAFTTSLRQFLNLVLTNVLTRYAVGAQTAFINAEVIFQTALGILAVSPAMAVYPRLAQMGNARDYVGIRELLERSIQRLGVLLGFAGAMLAALAPWIVGAVFSFGGLDPTVRAFTVAVLLAYGFALLPWGINQLMLRAFYAAGEIRRAVQVSAAIFALNTLGYWLLRDAGLLWLNLSTAVAGLVGLLAYVGWLERLSILSVRWLLRLLLRIAAAALPAGLLAHLAARPFGTPELFLSNLPPLLVGGLVGLGVFVVFARLLRLPLRLGR
jgi:putative peptidoglycan lipid II flippase